VRPAASRRALVAVGLVAAVAAQAAVVGLAGAQLAPPPPTPVNGTPSAYPTALQTPSDQERAPAVSAPSALLADLRTGQVLWSKAPDRPRPIASVTKIMTALLVLEHTQPDDVVRVDPAAVFHHDDYGAGSTLGLRAGERITVKDLLYGLLLGSANDAAVALAIHVSGDEDSFVALMNRTARELGLRDTTFLSPNGLDDRGRSTATDLLRLTLAAQAVPGFETITATRVRRLHSVGGRSRRIQNRNALLWLYPGAFGTKTGSTRLARYCLVGSAERDGRRLVAVVLGAPEGAFDDAAALLNYGFEGFEDRALVDEGEELGTVRIRGGEVMVSAGEGLRALVPSAIGGEPERTVAVDPRAAFPPGPEERVGTLVLTLRGRVLGRVPAIVRSLPQPEPANGPWWARAAGSVARALGDAVGALAA
jgi:serine-type D-Ala-D-Ala carboxypeptidase (penicillin-binding protein 5/6)